MALIPATPIGITMEKIDEGAALRCSLNNEEFRERQASIQRNILPEIVAAHLIDSIF